jgi:hypothetical protein
MTRLLGASVLALVLGLAGTATACGATATDGSDSSGGSAASSAPSTLDTGAAATLASAAQSAVSASSPAPSTSGSAPASASASSSAPSSASASPSATGSPSATSGVPSRTQWLADVKTAMQGARKYVRQQLAAAGPGAQLAVNFDIDNTVLATYYDGGGAIPSQLAFTKYLQRNDVAVLFNTGRVAGQRVGTLRQLRRAGLPVDGLCLRQKGRTLPYGKQACRTGFAKQGYTLIANVGNNDTDFAGSGYGRAFELPNYGGVLG